MKTNHWCFWAAIASILTLLTLVGCYLVWIGAAEVFLGKEPPWIVSFRVVLAQISILISLGSVILAKRHQPDYEFTERWQPIAGWIIVSHLLATIAAAAYFHFSGRQVGPAEAALFDGILTAMMAGCAMPFALGLIFPSLGLARPREGPPSPVDPPAQTVRSPIRTVVVFVVALFFLRADIAAISQHGWFDRRSFDLVADLLIASLLGYWFGQKELKEDERGPA